MPKLTIVVDKPTRLKKNAQSLYVSFPYDIEAVSHIKSIQIRHYIPETRLWEVPVNEIDEILRLFNKYDISIKGKVETDSQLRIPDRVIFEEVKQEEFAYKTLPFGHQIEGVQFGKKTKKFLLADDQGLGKTKQAIDLAVSRKGQFKHCLIVCGVNSVKQNWLKEIEIHSNESGHILGSYYNTRNRLVDGTLQDRLDDLMSDLDDYFLITNIETLRQGPKSKKVSAMTPMELTQKRILDRLEKLTKDGVIGMVVIDEIHKAKNHSGQQGKAIHRLMPDYKMALTGTPVVNRPTDVYNILKWLEVENNAFTHFRNYYCIMGGFANAEVMGYKNLNRLEEKLHGVMLRRKKEDVLDLPPKIRQNEYVEMSRKQLKLYTGIRDEIIQRIEEIEISPNPLAMLTRLRQVTSCPEVLSDEFKDSAKMERMEQMIEEIVEGGNKAIVFSNWSKVTRVAQKRLAKYNPAYIDGTTSDRMGEVDRFQEDPNCHVIIGTIGAMGTGLTLTAANNVIFIDKPWSPANRDQAEDRAHRIGTKGTVNIITLVVEDTIDERIEELIEEKQEYIDGLVEGKVDKLQKIQMIHRLLE